MNKSFQSSLNLQRTRITSDLKLHTQIFPNNNFSSLRVKKKRLVFFYWRFKKTQTWPTSVCWLNFEPLNHTWPQQVIYEREDGYLVERGLFLKIKTSVWRVSFCLALPARLDGQVRSYRGKKVGWGGKKSQEKVFRLSPNSGYNLCCSNPTSGSWKVMARIWPIKLDVNHTEREQLQRENLERTVCRMKRIEVTRSPFNYKYLSVRFNYFLQKSLLVIF